VEGGDLWVIQPRVYIARNSQLIEEYAKKGLTILLQVHNFFYISFPVPLSPTASFALFTIRVELQNRSYLPKVRMWYAGATSPAVRGGVAELAHLKSRKLEEKSYILSDQT
jgi:hypothetical protein